MEKNVRVRFAPSPTGPLHMGGVRTALYNYLFAKKMGGTFILRIEDTDQTRFVAKAEEYIIEALKWCGIPATEGVGFGEGAYGPYRQSERKHMYKQYADALIEKEHAYYAFDTPEELVQMRENLKKAGVAAPQYNAITRHSMKNSLTLSAQEVQHKLESGEPYVIRLKVPRNEEIKFNDIIRGWVVVQSSNIDDKVLYKSDGMPTYHLANVVDDYLMKITHVIRGEEWLPSAPLHVLLYRFLEWEEVMPRFAHLPLILRPDGNGKLSKRDGDRLGFPVFPLNWTDPETGENSTGYKERGYYPQAFLNMLALLGWNSGTNQEIFSLEELISAFSLERVSKSGAKFDPEKTKWFNQQYLRKQTPLQLAQVWMPELIEKGINADSVFVEKVCSLLQEKAHFINEFWSLGSYFFTAPAEYDKEVIKKRWNEKGLLFLETFHTHFLTLSEYNSAEIEAVFKTVCEQLQIKPGEVMQLLRVSITGVGGGPALFEIMGLLGKQEASNRIKTALVKMPSYA
ncbi:MAG: glutamate--tRNA ligase [Bacteroidetes bacterium]|nr:glutamate--tRNA ligase [Bacteroidota bacterium]MBV6462544.1 Glutamate--tRNA ligase [Flavobacteriales bacterium]WKZ75168.1 MAG: glutamate--tRNA ligase [Vicingaceae bacterium]MCL4817376.1 glutamate--tRNA ligase [Flavobacteriales bacterium]NOG96035.1 glutamate--tRNA ligase [Bacteroidota bacterium]